MELTNLDKDLLKLANEDPAKFIKLVGDRQWIRMKVCILRKKGSSYGQIVNKLSTVTVKEIRGACQKCE